MHPCDATSCLFIFVMQEVHIVILALPARLSCARFWQDLAVCWEDHNLPPDQPPTPRPLPDSDTDSDSGRAESSFSDYGPAQLNDYAIPLPGTPMAPALEPLHKRAARWLRKKWKKGLLLGAYLGKEWKEQMGALRYVN